MTKNEIEWWDSEQTANFLGVSIQTLTKWSRRGEGPTPTRLTYRLQYNADVVRAWVEKRQRESEQRQKRLAAEYSGIDAESVRTN